MANMGSRKLRLQQIAAEDRRLRILQLLADSPGRIANEAVLAVALPALGGHNPSRDVLRNDLMWLSETLLIDLTISTKPWVAQLVQRGEDVARGRAAAFGVAVGSLEN